MKLYGSSLSRVSALTTRRAQQAQQYGSNVRASGLAMRNTTKNTIPGMGTGLRMNLYSAFTITRAIRNKMLTTTPNNTTTSTLKTAVNYTSTNGLNVILANDVLKPGRVAVVPSTANLGVGQATATRGYTIAQATRSYFRTAYDYLKLSKHKLSALVVYTAMVGYIMRAPYVDDTQNSEANSIANTLTVEENSIVPFSWFLAQYSLNTAHRLLPETLSQWLPSTGFLHGLAVTTIGTTCTAAAANALNQIYERYNDAYMPRTRNRPLPTGRISVTNARIFAAFMTLTGAAVLYWGQKAQIQMSSNSNAGHGHDDTHTCPSLSATTPHTNNTLLPLVLGLGNILLYAGLYTPLKVISPINTWVGAVVGAVPPLIGWSVAAAVSPSNVLLEPGAALLFTTLFAWQIPHFHALAVVCRKDYTLGGYKMLAQLNPVSNALWARRMAWFMLPIGPLATFSFNLTSPFFALEALAMSSWMITATSKLVHAPESVSAARPLFRASIAYLPIILAFMVFHKSPHNHRLDQSLLLPSSQRHELQTPTDQKVYYYHPSALVAPFPFLPLPGLLDPIYIDDRSNI